MSQMREMALDLDFFGASATGSNLVFLLDCTWSGADVFARTREELLKTLGQMRESRGGQFSVIYFGGQVAGHVVGKMNVDPTDEDYWFPKGIRSRQWISPVSEEAQMIIDELKAVDPSDPKSKVEFAKDLDKPGAFFVLGTQYWGAMNAAFRMRPAPDTVFFLIEANVAFPNVNAVRRSYEWFEKHGRRKPDGTVVRFIMGNAQKDVRSKAALHLMVNLVNGGDLSEEEIQELITYTR